MQTPQCTMDVWSSQPKAELCDERAPTMSETQPLTQEEFDTTFLLKAHTMALKQPYRDPGHPNRSADFKTAILNLATLAGRIYCELGEESDDFHYSHIMKDLHETFNHIEAYTPGAGSANSTSTPISTSSTVHPPAFSVDSLVPALIPHLRKPLRDDLKPRLIAALQQPLANALSEPLFNAVQQYLGEQLGALADLLYEPLFERLRDSMAGTLTAHLEETVLDPALASLRSRLDNLAAAGSSTACPEISSPPPTLQPRSTAEIADSILLGPSGFSSGSSKDLSSATHKHLRYTRSRWSSQGSSIRKHREC
ncbi:hypothetical protein BN946_scf184983.g39 [Trametes cinnabarina]|uniref:Uncharacterized protein n=1 Tax=Pycnoporus cinnabarinus TaxID=5643 RepID=A0A060SEA3_PYCCI|nr:hypothetical protein BN946_scf184983.g39 [Trametes cinnabarina]